MTAMPPATSMTSIGGRHHGHRLLHPRSDLERPAGRTSGARRAGACSIRSARPSAGRRTELSRIIHESRRRTYGGDGARLWLDGRAVSPPGAALANGMTIDALDIHDGYTLVKGHAGAAIVPAVLSMRSARQRAGQRRRAVDDSVVAGYEVALRAGLALHGTACDYHTSGAWNALGCAAVARAALGLMRSKRATRWASPSTTDRGRR